MLNAVPPLKLLNTSSVVGCGYDAFLLPHSLSYHNPRGDVGLDLSCVPTPAEWPNLRVELAPNFHASQVGRFPLQLLSQVKMARTVP